MLDLLFEKRASLENPSTSLSDPANWLHEALGAVPSSANIVVNDKTAMQIAAFWSAVNTISDTLAELPIRLVHNKKNGTTRIIKTHPALALLKTSSNPWMTPVTLKSTMQSYTLTHGNGYGMINFLRSGEPAEIWPLAPSTKPKVVNGQLWYDAKLDHGREMIPADNIIHVPALARNSLEGMSIIAAQRDSLGQAIAVKQFGAKFFANGAKPGGLIKFPGKVKDPGSVRQQIEENYGGDNVHNLLVLDQDADYRPFAIPPDDAQFLQSQEFSVDDIGRMFRLPAHFLNKMGQATFNNLEQMGAHFVQYTLIPWLCRWEQELTRKLLTEEEIRRGYCFKFITAGLMRGDIKTRSEVYSSAIQTGWLTRNEVRGYEELNPLPGLDEPLMPANMVVVGEEPDEGPPPSENPPPDPGAVDVGEDEDEGEENSRHFLIADAMCRRMIAKECNAVPKILQRNQEGELEDFYLRHMDMLEENLGLLPEEAVAYCERHMDQARSSDDTAQLLLEWRTQGHGELLQLTGEARL